MVFSDSLWQDEGLEKTTFKSITGDHECRLRLFAAVYNLLLALNRILCDAT